MRSELTRWKERYSQWLAKTLSQERINGCLSSWIPEPYEEADAKRFIHERVYADEEKELCRVILFDSQPVGSIELYRREGGYCMTAALFFWLEKEYINEDILAPALRELCEEALERFGVVRIEAIADSEDLASRSALNDAGFELEGVMRKSLLDDGSLRDRCIYALVDFERYSD